MNRKRSILLLGILGVLALTAAGHPVRWLESGLLMADMAAGESDSPWKWLTRPSERIAIAWSASDGDRAGDLYRPARTSRGAIVVLPGAAPRGRDEPRLVAFAQSLSRAGFVVLVPDMANLRSLQPSTADIRSVGEAIEELSVRVPEHEPGVLAFSYAVGPAMLAAIADNNCARMGYVVGIGGYHDIRAVVRYFTTGFYRAPGGGEWLESTPNEFGKWLFVLANASRLESDRDRDLLKLIATARLKDRDADIGDWFGGLGTEGRRVFDLVANSDPAQVDRLIDALPQAVRSELDGLNPAARPLDGLRCRVILVHGRDDRIIPYTESVALARAVGPAAAEMHLVDAIGHVEFDALRWANVAPLWRAVDSLLALRD